MSSEASRTWAREGRREGLEFLGGGRQLVDDALVILAGRAASDGLLLQLLDRVVEARPEVGGFGRSRGEDRELRGGRGREGGQSGQESQGCGGELHMSEENRVRFSMRAEKVNAECRLPSGVTGASNPARRDCGGSSGLQRRGILRSRQTRMF